MMPGRIHFKRFARLHGERSMLRLSNVKTNPSCGTLRERVRDTNGETKIQIEKKFTFFSLFISDNKRIVIEAARYRVVVTITKESP